MKQINSNWEDKTTVKKGNFAEEIIKNYLEDKGYVVYEPVTNKAHGFDKFAMKDKETIIYIECKAKARRKYYEDTGINISHYNDYMRLSKRYDMPIFIFFIDEYVGEIYGNWLVELNVNKTIKGKSYPLKEKGIMYFPLENMRKIEKLKLEQIDYLKNHSTRNYEY